LWIHKYSKFGTCARELLEDDAQEEDVFNLAS
jgi:hypothetical protein